MTKRKYRTKCDGCSFIRTNSKDLCLFRLNHQIKLCPCIECLVKVTCKSRCTLREETISNELINRVYKTPYGDIGE